MQRPFPFKYNYKWAIKMLPHLIMIIQYNLVKLSPPLKRNQWLKFRSKHNQCTLKHALMYFLNNCEVIEVRYHCFSS